MKRSKFAELGNGAIGAAMLAATSLTGVAHAQAAKDDEIIVTATRREEALRDVPASVSVLSPAQLARTGARDMGDYLFAQPGVNYRKDGRAGRGDISIRGVTTGTVTTPTVGVYVDDVPIGSAVRFADGASAFDQSLLDLGRIEVLKGPQGTLFGVSAMGGVVRFVTTRPEIGDSTVNAGLDVSSTDGGGMNYTVNGNANLPLGETAALRIAAFNTSDEGYVDAAGPRGGDDRNSSDSRGARIALRWEPSAKLGVNLSAQIQRSEQDGLSYVDYSLATGRPIIGDLKKGVLRFDEPQDIQNELYTAGLSYDLGWATFSSVTAFQTMSFDARRDFSGVYQIFSPFFFPPPAPQIASVIDKRKSSLDKWTQEFRLVSKGDGPLKWQGGVFYTTENGGISQDIVQTFTTGRTATGTRTDPYIFGPGAGFDSDYKEIAAYGTVDWSVTERLTLTAGARVAHNEIDTLQINGGIQGPGPNARGSTSEDPATYLVAARYAINDDNNVYARVASGYRAGGPNLGLVDPITFLPLSNSPTYESDSLVNYEVGYKGALLDDKLRVDAAVYQIDWDNLQQTIVRNGVGFLGNAGAARIKGTELGVIAKPTEALSFGGSFSWIDAKLTEDALVGLRARKGSRLPNTSEFTANLFAEAKFPIGGRSSFVRVDQLFLGDRNSSYVQDVVANPNFVLKGFEQTDLSAGIDFERFRVGFYVRNLTDERGQLSAETNQAPFGLPAYVTVTRPRTTGLTLSASF